MKKQTTKTWLLASALLALVCCFAQHASADSANSDESAFAYPPPPPPHPYPPGPPPHPPYPPHPYPPGPPPPPGPQEATFNQNFNRYFNNWVPLRDLLGIDGRYNGWRVEYVMVSGMGYQNNAPATLYINGRPASQTQIIYGDAMRTYDFSPYGDTMLNTMQLLLGNNAYIGSVTVRLVR